MKHWTLELPTKIVLNDEEMFILKDFIFDLLDKKALEVEEKISKIEQIRCDEMLDEQKDEILEEIWDMIFASYPKDMECFDTITEDQAYRLLKSFWNKLKELNK